MNKQSNSYTIIYIIVLVVVVGAALAFTAMGLKDRQQQNADADRMRQILAAVHITPAPADVVADFGKYITSQAVVNSRGETVGDDAFAVSVAAQVKRRRTSAAGVYLHTARRQPQIHSAHVRRRPLGTYLGLCSP